MKRDPKNFDEMWGNIRVFRIIFFIVTPPIYLIIAHDIDNTLVTGGEHDIMFYMLLIVAVCAPALLPIINRFQIKTFKKNHNSRMSKFQFTQSIFIIRASLVILTYVLGLSVLFVSGDFSRLYTFYPIGIAWTLVFWPRRARYESLINELETP